MISARPLFTPQHSMGTTLHNALQRTNYSSQDDGTTGRTPGFESTGLGFESRRHGFDSTDPEVVIGQTGSELGNVNSLNLLGRGFEPHGADVAVTAGEITPLQKEKTISPENSCVFESHCTDVDVMVGGNTPLQNDQALSLTTSLSVKAAHTVELGFDSCEKVSASKLSNVKAALEEFN